MPTQTVTVLFTDLEGSTALMSRVGEERAELLRREYFALLRAAVEEHGGQEVKNVGDGLMVVFTSSEAALSAAAAMQQQLHERNRRSDERLAIRIGISIGNVDVDDGDFFGRPVVEAARLCAAATGDQILTTEIVRSLTGTRGEHQFESVGELQLKGLDEPVPTCALVWAPLHDQGNWGVRLPSRVERAGAAFVGRANEREVLQDARTRVAVNNRAHVVLVSGEPGIGKTSLVCEAARSAFDDGAVVLYGRCDEDLAIPYQPWAEALRHLVDHAPDSWIDALRPEVARLVPEARTRRPDLVAPIGSEPAAERYLLFAAVADFLADVSRDVPVVIVLDDLHWSDRPTIQLLRRIATSDDPMRVLVIATFRDADVDADHPLVDALSALHRDDSSTRIMLRGFDDAELLTLMEGAAGHALDGSGLKLRDALLSETDGNPFFVGEMLRHLTETGAIARQADGTWATTSELRARGLPVSVREVVGKRVAHLGSDMTPLLSAASVIGREFDLATLAHLVEENDSRVLDHLERARGASLLTESSPEHFSFAHALVEHALYSEIGTTRRARLHRRVAEIIEEQSGAEPRERAAELAYHWSEASGDDNTAKIIEYARYAGDAALTQLAPDEARSWYQRGLDLLRDSSTRDDDLECLFLVSLGDAQQQSADPSYRETLLEAARLADRIDNVELLVRAVIANNRGFFSATGLIDEERIAMLRRALERVDQSNLVARARVSALLALELIHHSDSAGRRALADDAIACARACGDAATLLRVFNVVYLAIISPETLEERVAISGEALRLARELGDVVEEFWVFVYSEFASYDKAEPTTDLLRKAHAIAVQVGQPRMLWVMNWLQSCDRLRAGDIALAEDLAGRALETALESREPDAMVIYGAQLAAVRWNQGRREEMIPLIAPIANDMDLLPAFRALLAASYLDANDAASARALLAERVPTLPPAPNNLQWLCELVLWTDVAVRLHDTTTAALLYEYLRPFPVFYVFEGADLWGSVADSLGRLAGALGNYEDSQLYFDLADDLDERFEAPFFIARSKLHRAQMHVARGDDPRTEPTNAHITEALEIARRHGFAGIERDATELRERAIS